MTDISIKTEKNDDDSQVDSSLPELTKLLEEVKREEQVSSDESDFLDDLLKENEECGSASATEDDDIRQLQELLEKKKKELDATDASAQDSRSKNRKRKNKNRDGKPSRDGTKESKRKRRSVDESRRSGSRSPRSVVHVSCIASDKSPISRNQSSSPQTPASTSVTNLEESSFADIATAIDELPSAESEIANLLKAEDPDDEPTNSNQEVPSTSGLVPPYGCPPGFPQMAVPMYDPACQMMGNIPPSNYPLMYNMGMQAPFYPNMGNMPMMGYGIPQMNILGDQNELQCLPVVNSTGFSGMPTFKRIKLERNAVVSTEDKDKDEVPDDDRRKNVLEACTALLEQLEFSEPKGKFTFTSTVAKLSADIVSNSIVQKISNVSYDFHSIGPKLNLANWGLKEIGSLNGDIAKKIAISADEYFAKITTNTMVGKLIKVEDANVDDNTNDLEMETEEPTLSSFLKNSMTQTDALVCKECVARKRIIGHNIGVQATVFTGSIGSQTSPVVDDSVRLAAGLNVHQLKALYTFSSLIREPVKNTTVEMYKLRESLMEIYNLSQRSHNGPVPNISPRRRSPPPPPAIHHAPGRDPRINNRADLDSRQFNPPGRPMPNLGRPAPQADPRHPQFNNYQPHPTNVPRHQSPVMPNYGYQHPAVQLPAGQFPGSSFGEPVYPPHSLQSGPKRYDHGSQPR